MTIIYAILIIYFILAITAACLVYPALILSARFSQQEDQRPDHFSV
jgi:hypothetical protein